jgi:hypothetical protein
MELLCLAGIVIVVLGYNGGLIAWNLARGGFPAWDRQSQNEARTMFLSVVAVSVAIVVVVFGAAALVAIWPFWLALAVLAALAYGLGEIFARRNERRARRASPYDVLVDLADDDDDDGMGPHVARRWLSERAAGAPRGGPTSYDVLVYLAENDADGIGGKTARRWLSERGK